MAEAGQGRGRGGPRGRGRGGFKRPMAQEYDDFSGSFMKKRKINDDVYRFLVREDLVKIVIGKGGENIKKIKEDAKAAGIETKVSIFAQGSSGTGLMEGAMDRVMSVQSTGEGLEMALNDLVDPVQLHQNMRGSRGGRGAGGGDGDKKAQKLELRLLVPAHTCSAIIGTKGSVIKAIKEETSSFIQVYTLALPKSEEHCVRIQNFERADLVTTAIRVFEAIAEIKGKNPILMYEPICFEFGEYGDTGSYIDSDWYRQALRSGVAKPTSFKDMRASGHGGGQAPYEDPYAEYGDPYGYEEGYEGGYEEEYYDDSYYAPPPPPRGHMSRGGPRGGFGGAPRGGRGRGGYPMRSFQARAGFSRGAPRGRGGSVPYSQQEEVAADY